MKFLLLLLITITTLTVKAQDINFNLSQNKRDYKIDYILRK